MLLATAGSDNRIKIWSFDNGSSSVADGGASGISSAGGIVMSPPTELVTVTPDVLAEITALAFSYDSRYLAHTTHSKIVVWDVAAMSIVWEDSKLPCHVHRFSGPERITFSLVDNRLFGVSDCKVKCWTANSGECTELFPREDFYTVTCNTDGNIMAGTEKCLLKVYNVETEELLYARKADQLYSNILDVCFARDGERIVTCTADAKLTIWNSMTGEVLKSILRIDGTDVRRCCVTWDGNHVIVGGHTHYIRVCKTTAESSVEKYCLRYLETRYIMKGISAQPDTDNFAIGSSCGEVVMFSTKHPQELCVWKAHDGYVSTLCFSPASSVILM
jgi:WD40 repeat protein